METAAAPGPGWAAEGERRRRRCSRRDRDREQRRRRGPGGDAPRALLAAPRGSSSSSSPPPPARPWSSASSGERPGGPRRRRPRPRPRPPRPRARKRPAGSGSRGEEEEEEGGCADDGEAEEEPEEEEEEEEDLIDGFAIASFASLEALQKDASLQPPERLEHRLKHSGKRKRGGSSGATGEPGDSSDREPGRPSGDRARKWPNKRRRKEVSSRHSLEAGYICDAESDLDERVSDDDLDPSFTVSTSKASGPHGAFNGNCEAKLSIVPKVSGLERSQEQPPGPDPLLVPFPPKEPPPPPAPRPPVSPPAPLPATPSLPPPPQLQLRVSPFGLRTSPYGSSLDLSTGSSSRPPPKAPAPPVAQPPPSSSSSSSSSSSASSSSAQLTHRPPTPSLPLPLSNHSFPPPGLRPPPPPHHPSLFSPGPTLPPPPPLLQVPGHPGASAANALSEQDLIGQDLNSRYPEVVGAGGSARPLAFQFHQHNHQHQHTHQHTHQHFTPYPPGLLPPHGPHMFEKYPGKMEGLFRHNPYTAFPPAVPGLPPGLPPAVSFGSLQGAFQPKSMNPELPPRLGPMPSGLPPKGTQIPDHFRPPLRKPGKWCAMHVRVAYMILRHQEKMKGDSHKLDFRNDLLPCLPGPYGALPTGQELSHPAASLFTATGAVHAAANPFTAAPGAHGPFLSPSTHIDPFGRPTSFASLAALSNGAFGGLGSPTFNSGAVFAQKESPGAPPAFVSPPDPWGRLHRSPLAFPAWVRPPEAARTPGSDKERPVERRETSITKEEKDRDLPFSRPQPRVSPATPKARAGEEGARPAKESVRVKEERKEEAAAAAAAATGPQGLHLLFERPRPPPFLGPGPPERCAGFLEPTWLAGPPRLARPPRFYEAGEELTGPGAVAAARLYGLEPAHPLLYSRLAPPPPPTAAPGTPHLLSKTPPGALLGAPPPLVPAPRPSSPPRAPGPARADR
ncbi:probable fibrosin-1 [Eptesicus fuscus]|uniref:probable fibrosin-1 n=1 Tax=Eptesicus fuscus TaxID=29078 RepID=UPI002403BDD6|nr:probable fibrosin-1 [Eptesicus fuscus]